MLRISICIAIIALLFTSASFSQESHSEFSLQGSGFFTKSTSGDGVISQTPTKTAGFLVSYRYYLSQKLSLEGVYGFDRNTQKFMLSSGDFRIPSNNHQFTVGLDRSLPSFGKGRFSPYVLIGGGAYVFSPASTVSGAQTQAKAAFVYGGGVNYAILKRVSLRFEYRGLVYSAPDMGLSGINTKSIAHSAQPSVGLSFRF